MIRRVGIIGTVYQIQKLIIMPRQQSHKTPLHNTNIMFLNFKLFESLREDKS